MALFSRRKKSDPTPDEVPDTAVEPGEQPVDPSTPADSAPKTTGPSAGPDAAGPDAAVPEAAEPTPSVGISVSSFRGLGGGPGRDRDVRAEQSRPEGTNPPAAGAATAGPASDAAAPATPRRRAVPAEAPPATETVPGLRDNALLRQALAALPPKPGAPELMNVMRQLLQGHVFLRVQGDARALLSEGKPLPLSVAQLNDKQYVLAYSGGEPIQTSVRTDGNTATSAMGQPVGAVLKYVLSGPYEGIILDNNSAPARAVIPRAVLQKAYDDLDEAQRVKTILAAPRTDATAAEVVSALVEAPLWIAVKRAAEGGAVGVAETRTADGQRFLEVFSHPLEALVLGRGDTSAPLTVVQLATALDRDAALSGIIIDPAGPWIRLTRDDLVPLLALAEPA